MEVLLDYELIKLLWDYKKRQALADDEFVKKAIITILDKRNALESCRRKKCDGFSFFSFPS